MVDVSRWLCREVHHGGMGEERDAVSRLGGEEGGAEEDPGPPRRS